MLYPAELLAHFYGAGDGNRTRVSSLEGWCSTIELHPQIHSSLFQLEHFTIEVCYCQALKIRNFGDFPINYVRYGAIGAAAHIGIPIPEGCVLGNKGEVSPIQHRNIVMGIAHADENFPAQPLLQLPGGADLATVLKQPAN